MGAGSAEVADDEHDPFEGLNRAIFRINESFDESILKPVARGYAAAVPDVLKLSIANFLSNLLQPTVAINDLLQGKFRQSGQDTARFIINTTMGFGGLFDVTRNFDLPANEEDFGQTLATWGVADGPYLVLPILGPKNLRDGVGWIVDQFAYPLNYRDERAVVWGGRSLDIVDTRARFLPADKVLEQAAGDDKYLFVREAYRQRRRNLIYDGNPPKEDFFLDDPTPPVPGQPKQ
jgi:phospholipid-binding lipoprotein MlaA